MTQKQLIRNLQFAVLLLVLITTIACGASGALAQEGSGTYTVRPGDTLARIAKDHGTTVKTLVDLNKDRYPSLADNPGLIEVGWTLQLPGSADAGADTDAQNNATAKPVVTPTPAMTIEEAELEIVRLINEERAKVGAPPLEVDPVLMEVARLRSEDMVKRGYFSHYDPETNELLVRKLVAERGYNPNDAGENVFKQTTSLRHVITSSVAWWMNSDGHRQNILRNDFHATGVGIVVTAKGSPIIITQVFLR